MIRFALVVPSTNFIDVADEIFVEHNRLEPNPGGEEYQMEEVIISGKEVERVRFDADVIITRGLLAQLLQNAHPTTPVVEVRLPATDILRTVNSCIRDFASKKIGVIAAQNMVMGTSEIGGLCSTPVQTYTLGTDWNGPALVAQALKDGCDTIIGGKSTCNYAEMIHVKNRLIQVSKDAFWQALTEAKRAVWINRNEQEKTNRLQVILDSSKEGFLSIDAAKRIRLVNRRAERILNPATSLLDVKVQDTDLPLELKKLLLDPHECNNELVQAGGAMLTVNKHYIRVKNAVVGSVINLQEVEGIQSLEGSIRKKIYSKGHVAKATFGEIIGDAPVMRQLITQAKKYSLTGSNILITGSSGAGKEILAQSIHNHSDRRLGPFVAVNCAAIPELLLESELFGYAPGAFTGAQKTGRPGFFELAHNGTIFLDEIGEIPLKLQAKLLRAIQEREIMRVGGDSVMPVNIRIISASNKPLEAMVAQKEFREDLFYRLDVLHLHLPSLAQRREDIPLLVDHYFRTRFPGTAISEEAKGLLRSYAWHGNVRQLFNICERLAVLGDASPITRDQVLEAMGRPPVEAPATEAPSPAPAPDAGDERARIAEALQRARYNREEAARLLGISRSTLWRRIKALGLD